jgi:acetyltransferase-like isoleucine patch superfamily enzyme/dTDP-4-dehydrorhamnose 3,5-epimerase-like enzyme
MTYTHPNAICESKAIGDGTRIWAFAHVLGGAVIGEECNICDHVFIENDVVIGDRVTVKCGVQLWDGLRVEDDVFIGPNATFTNDLFPRSRQRPNSFATTKLEQGCSIGANATLLPGLSIGRNSMVGAGAVVTRSVPPNAIVHGNPATIQGYTSALKATPLAKLAPEEKPFARSDAIQVEGASIHKIPSFEDIRGRLVAGEIEKELPFTPVRFFVVYAVPSSEVRGEHAHRVCHQFLICVKGSVHIVVDDARVRQEIILSRPDTGLYLQPYVWGTQYKYSADAVLLVFASHPYDPDDYIRDYNVWLNTVKDR